MVRPNQIVGLESTYYINIISRHQIKVTDFTVSLYVSDIMVSLYVSDFMVWLYVTDVTV